MPDRPLGEIVRELAAAREKATPQRGQFVWVEGQIVHGDQPSDFPKRARIHIHGIGTGIPLAFKPVTERKTKSNLAQMVLDLMDDRWRDFLAGVEFGVRAHEKGMNLQAALEDAKKMSQKEQP